MSWSIVYKRAIAEDGTLLFPEKLTKEFLDIQKRKLGSYQFSNQYQNEIIPEEMQTFKKNWFKYYTVLPERYYTFAMIDPAIGQKRTSDYTGITVVSVDVDTNWYVRLASRQRLTPTEIVNKCFQLQTEFKCMGIGVEAVAYQEALVYMLHEEMQRRKILIPIKEIRPPTDRTKEARIRSLVPRYEFGRIFHSQGLYDLEQELLLFPRGSFVDIADSLCAQEELVIYPEPERIQDVRPHSPSDPRYEGWFIRNRLKATAET